MSEDIYKAARRLRDVEKGWKGEEGDKRNTKYALAGYGGMAAGKLTGQAASSAIAGNGVLGPQRAAMRMARNPDGKNINNRAIIARARQGRIRGGRLGLAAGVGGYAAYRTTERSKKARGQSVADEAVGKALTDAGLTRYLAVKGPMRGTTEYRAKFGQRLTNRAPKNFSKPATRRLAGINIADDSPVLTGRKPALPARRGLDPEGTVASLRGSTTQRPGRSAVERKFEWQDQLKRVAGDTKNVRASSAAQEQLTRWNAGEARRTAVRATARQAQANNPFGTPGLSTTSPRVAAAARARRDAAAAAAPAKKKRSWFGR